LKNKKVDVFLGHRHGVELAWREICS